MQEVIIEKAFLLLVWLSIFAAAWRTKSYRVLTWSLIGYSTLYAILYILPLQRAYGLLLNRDRMYNVAHAASYLAGNPIFEGPYYAGVPTLLSPVWPLVVSIISWLTGLRIDLAYNWSSVLIAFLLPLTIYFAWSNKGDKRSQQETVLMIVFALFLTTIPDIMRSGFARGFWGNVIMLKPTHAAALIFVLLMIRLMSDWSREAYVPLILAITIYAFAFWGGIAIISYAIFYLFMRDRGWRGPENWVWLIFGILAALLFASPYLWAAFKYHIWQANSHFEPIYWDSKGKMMIYDIWVSTVLMGPVWWLGLWGIKCLWQREDWKHKAFLSFIIAVYLTKLATMIGYPFGLGPEPDDTHNLIFFLMALVAGIGASDLIERLWPMMRHGIHGLQLTVLTLLIATPLILPIWYVQQKFDANYIAALKPIEPEILAMAENIKSTTRPSDEITADREMAQWIGALTGRRVILAGDGRLLNDRDFEFRQKKLGDKK